MGENIDPSECLRAALIWIKEYQNKHGCVTEWHPKDGSYIYYKNIAINGFKQNFCRNVAFIGFDYSTEFKNLTFVIFSSGEIWAYINEWTNPLSFSAFVRYEGNISEY